MNKKFIRLIAVTLLMLTVFGFSGCKLAVTPPEAEPPLRLVGMAVIIADEDDFSFFDEEIDFDSPDVLTIIMATKDQNGDKYTEFLHNANGLFITKNEAHYTDNVKKEYKIESDIFILQTADNKKKVVAIPLYSADGGTTIERGMFTIYSTQIQVSTSIETSDEYKENGKIIDAYSFKFTLNINYVDYLEYALVREFDGKNNLIASTAVNQPSAKFTLNPATEYVILEEHFVNHKNETVIVRALYNAADNFIHHFLFAGSKGYVENGITSFGKDVK